MVKLDPETEAAPVQTRSEDASAERAIVSSTWGFEGSRSATTDEAGQAAGPPGKRSSDSSGGGRFWRRLIPQRPGGEGSGIDLRNTWQVVAGSILVPMGVVLILIAWYGAAHTAYVQQQIPYLVSGSFAGLGCIVLGGLFYWAHWLYRLYDQADQHHEEQPQAMQLTLRAISERLSGGNGSGAPHLGDPAAGPDPVEARPHVEGHGQASEGTPPPRPSSPSWTGQAPYSARSGAGAGVLSATYVVTSSGSVYHLPSCPVIAHHTEGLRVLGTGAVVEMEACRICLPGEGERTDG